MSAVHQRTFASEQHVMPGSACPHRNLVALVSAAESSAAAVAAPAAQAEGETHKVQLWRTTGTSTAIWEWKPTIESAAAPTSTLPVKPAPRLLGLKGKAKAATATTSTIGAKIDSLAWSPSGEHLAVVYSAAAVTKYAILSLHSGKPVLPPLTLAHAVSHVDWLAAEPDDIVSPSLRSVAIIKSLPVLPPVSKATATSTAQAAAGPTGFAGARAALLARRKAVEEDAPRPLDFDVAAGDFGSLIRREAQAAESDSDEAESPFVDADSVLCLAAPDGRMTLLLGGRLSIGTARLSDAARRSFILPSAISLDQLNLGFLSASPGNQHLAQVPFTYSMAKRALAAQITHLRCYIEYAFRSVQEARTAWDESRRIAKAWVARLKEVCENHADNLTVVPQLLFLLATGRPSVALHEFLANKMNEKAIGKWEDATLLALSKVKDGAFQSLLGSMQRSMIILEEISRWKEGDYWLPDETFLQLGLDRHREETKACLRLGSRIVESAYELTKLATEEERCFVQTRRWIKYELDKLAQAEGSDIKPEASFHPTVVSYYLGQCLPDERNSVSPYLSFGLTSTPLDKNPSLAEVEAWLSKSDTGNTQSSDDDDSQSAQDAWTRWRTRKTGPKSVPALLHLFAARTSSLCGKLAADPSLEQPVGSPVLLEGAVELPTVSVGSDGLRTASVKNGQREQFYRSVGVSDLTSAGNSSSQALQASALEWLDHDHVVLALDFSGSGAACRSGLAVLPVDRLAKISPSPSLPVDQSQMIEFGYAPGSLTVSRQRKTFAISVGSRDGRKMQTWIINRPAKRS